MLDAVSVIDSDAAARRLARAIIADIELYNSHDTSESAMSAAVAEGRSAFQRRVGPALRGVFEEALGQTRLSAFAGDFGAMPHPPLQPRPTPPPGTRSNTNLLIGVAIVMTVAAAAWFFAAHGAGTH
jgi:hypothetical protein